MRRRDITRAIAISLGLHGTLVLGAIVSLQNMPPRSTAAPTLDVILVTLSGSASAASVEPRREPSLQPRPRQAQRADHPSIVEPTIELPTENTDVDPEAVEPSPTPDVSPPITESPSVAQGSVSQAADTGDLLPPSASMGDPMDAYRALVLTALERAKRYPILARERGVEGTVEIAFIIQPDGRVSDPEVVTSSRFRILDEAALGMVRRVGVLPPPPDPAPLRFPARIGYRLDSP